MVMRKRISLMLVCMMISVLAISSAYGENPILGYTEGDTYINSYLGYECRLEGWLFYSEDQLAHVNQMTKELVQSSEASDLISDKTMNKQIIAMAAQSDTGLENINIQFYYMPQYKKLLQAYGYSELVEAFTNQNLEQLQEGVASVIPADELTAGKVRVPFGNETKTGLTLSYSLNGITTYMKSVCLLTDDFMAWITASSMVTDTTDQIFQRFRPAE